MSFCKGIVAVRAETDLEIVTPPAMIVQSLKILSPLRLPISPPGHVDNKRLTANYSERLRRVCLKVCPPQSLSLVATLPSFPQQVRQIQAMDGRIFGKR